MKKQKFLVVILSVLLILPILVLPASAAIGTARVNADYSAITWGGHNYFRVDSSDIAYLPNTQPIYDLALANEEYKHVYSVSAVANKYAIQLTVSYIEGGYVNYYYIRDDKLDEYNNIVANGGNTFSVYLGYGFNEKTVTLSRSALYSNPITMTGSAVARYEGNIWVEYSALDGNIDLASRGYIFEDENGTFYFLDEYQFGTGVNRYGSIGERDTVTVYEITDKRLLGTS